MSEVTTDFAISYLLDDCDDCPENKDGECMTQSHCFKVKQMAIKALEQEQKTGHWEWVQYDSDPNIGNWHCSECRNIVMECAKKNEKGGILIYKYCPNCGARMAESEVQE